MPLTLLNLVAIRSISTDCGSSKSFSRTSVDCAAGLCFSVLRPCGCVGWPLYSCCRRITHSDRRSLSLSEDRVGHCDSFPKFYGSHLSAVELCQPLALAQRSLVPVCPVGGAHRHVVQRSPGRCRFGGFLGGLLRSVQAQAPQLSATVAAVGTPFRSPIPLPKRAPPQRASEPARGSLAPEVSDSWLGAVSGLAYKCCPPPPSQSLEFSASSTSALSLSLQALPVGPWWRRDISQLSCRAHVHLDFTRSSSSHWPHQPRLRCLQPPLQLWALRLARRFRRRSVHRDVCPLQRRCIAKSKVSQRCQFRR